MKEILIFAGTTEGRKLSELLCNNEIAHTVCVATEYGEIVLKEHPLRKIQKGRMDQEQIHAFIQNGNFAAVVDATHPYADLVTLNIKQAMEGLDISYLRLLRDTYAEETYDKIIHFESGEACAKALEGIDGNILLTTGSKELSKFCVSEAVKERLYVRVLPGVESISLCMENGIAGKQILAMQGPFQTELNEAIIRQYDIKCLVTKESGKNGGYQEKIDAAKNMGIPVYVIGHTKETKGDSFEMVCRKLEKICKKELSNDFSLNIILVGIGMGSKEILTKEAANAIQSADVLLGADRMIHEYTPKLVKLPLYTAEKIIPYLKDLQETTFFSQTGNVVILFSGDTGFYSGCCNLYKELEKRIKSGCLKATLRILPGISSVAYLASCVGESYHDAAVYSMHGKELLNLTDKIKTSPKTYILMSGVKDVKQLGKLLLDSDMTNCRVTVGYRLSYPEQKIKVLTPQECLTETEEGLYICLVKNPNAEYRKLTHGMADEEFIRDIIPMTKEEVREISICKLKLHENAIVYDVGSGTGSISVEIAKLSDTVRVYAIEQKEEAVSLIEENIEKFRLENISVITAKAPEHFNELPIPTHAFIGGSGGNMKEILTALYKKNSHMRVVINAVTMETICEIKEVISHFSITGEEIVQIQASRARKAGNYHLMQSENPVWICSFDFTDNEEVK